MHMRACVRACVRAKSLAHPTVAGPGQTPVSPHAIPNSAFPSTSLADTFKLAGVAPYEMTVPRGTLFGVAGCVTNTSAFECIHLIV